MITLGRAIPEQDSLVCVPPLIARNVHKSASFIIIYIGILNESCYFLAQIYLCQGN